MKWISVEDELPPKSTHERTHNVLLWCEDAEPWRIGYGCMSGKNGVNYPFVVEMWKDKEGWVVEPTHWMHLPAPPEYNDE